MVNKNRDLHWLRSNVKVEQKLTDLMGNVNTFYNEFQTEKDDLHKLRYCSNC